MRKLEQNWSENEGNHANHSKVADGEIEPADGENSVREFYTKLADSELEPADSEEPSKESF